MHTNLVLSFSAGVLAFSTLTQLVDAAPATARKARFSVTDFGAVGDGKTKDTAAIQRAIDAANKAGGGTVHLPPGTYLSGTLYLKSRVRLHIDFAAILLGSTDREDFPDNACDFRSYTDKYVRQALIWGEDLHDVAITGRGVIDGQGAGFEGLPWLERPYVIRLISCRNVLVENVTLRNSPMWMQHYLNCDFVTIRGIRVYNHCNRNNDMIDIDCCRDVVLSDCIGDTDDDALTLKSTADRPSKNITITNCILASHCNAIKMGTESNGGFENITITNCVIRPSRDRNAMGGRDNGLAGVALEIVDGGTLDRVTISNIVIRGVMTPIFLRLGNRARPFKKDMPTPPVGSLSNVVLSNIIATEATKVGCSITGLPGHPIKNVTISNVSISFAGGGTKQDADRAIDELPKKYPESRMFGTLPAYGFYVRHVDGLTFRDVNLRFAEPDHRPALVCDDVRNLDLNGLQARSTPDRSAMIRFHDVRDALIRGSRPSEATAVFLLLQGKTDRISVIGNDLSRVQKPFAFEDTVSPEVLFAESNRMRK